MLSALFEDIHCRYSLACAKLQEFLTPLLTSEIPNVVHMHHYLQRGREVEKYFPSPEGQKILTAYQASISSGTLSFLKLKMVNFCLYFLKLSFLDCMKDVHIM